MMFHEVKILAAALIATCGLYALTEGSQRAISAVQEAKGMQVSLQRNRDAAKRLSDAQAKMLADNAVAATR